MTVEITLAAPAKVNLCLGVGPVRADGFHPLATVYQALALYDEVRLRPSSHDRVVVVGDGVDVGEVPHGADNLALRAVHLLAAHHGRGDLTVEIDIRKRIPVAGGLAGGSTDAAAALVGADRLFELGTPLPELLALAAQLGSDVPFCVLGGTAVGSARGEQVVVAPTVGDFWWVVVPDPGGLSTPAVYAEFDRLHAGREVPDPVVAPALLEALAAGDVPALARALSNDLQPAALSFRPDLGDRLALGRGHGALAGLVSGSGPTTVFLCEDRGHAEEVDAALQGSGLPASILAAGPAQGPWQQLGGRGAAS